MEENKFYTTEEGSILRFFYEARKNEHRTKEEGRPIFDKSLNVEIITPGSRDSTPVHEIIREYENGDPPRQNEALYTKYRKYIQDFVEEANNPDLLGTSIDTWSALDITQRAMLNSLGLYTVEALAALPDGKIGSLGMGGRDLVARAKAFLDNASGSAKAEGSAARIVELEEELALKDAQIAELDAQISALKGSAAKESPKQVKSTAKTTV